MRHNSVWCDFDPGINWKFLEGLNHQTGLNFIIVSCINNKMSSKRENLIRYMKYIKFGFIHFIKRKDENIIVSWQQFYGLLFAFFCNIFHVKKINKLYIMTFIYIPKKGVLGKLYKYFIHYVLTSKYIDAVILNSSSEIDRYSKELNISRNIFHFVPLGEDLSQKKIESNVENNILFSSGYSNRNFDFLIDTLKNSEYKTYIFGKCNKKINNIVMSNEVVGDRISSILEKTKIVLIPLKEDREAGQLTLLHAMEKGVPVICTDTHCMRDYVIDGENGFLCENISSEWLSKIGLLMQNSELYKRMSDRAKQMYREKHTRYAMGLNVGAIINDLDYGEK